MSRVHDRELRREWVHRMLDHDGTGGEEGGIERWLVLTDALGLDRAYVVSMQGALPATRFAVEAYVDFVRERTLLEAVASSLTELFAPTIHHERISGMLENYDFIGERGDAVFPPPPRPGQPRRRLRPRLRQAPRQHAARSRPPPSTPCSSSATCCGPSSTPCTTPTSRRGLIPPGAFRPEDRMSEAGRAGDVSLIEAGLAAGAAAPHQAAPRRGARPLDASWRPSGCSSPDAIAVAVLQLCDGSRSVETIAAELAQTYNAPKERILADVTALLQDLADKGVVTA